MARHAVAVAWLAVAAAFLTCGSGAAPSSVNRRASSSAFGDVAVPPVAWCSPSTCVAMYPRFAGGRVTLARSLPSHGAAKWFPGDILCWPWQGRPFPERLAFVVRDLPPNSVTLISDKWAGLAYCARRTPTIFADGFESGDTSAWSQH